MEASTKRRPVAINVAQGSASAHCESCDARHIGMCDALTDDEMGYLSRIALRVTVAPAKVFIEEGEPAAYFYNIESGYVRVFKSLADGRRHITGFMGVGQFLGLGVGGQFAYSAEAIGEVKLCRFNRDSLKRIFAEFPALERRLLDIATHELTIAHDQMLLLGRKTAQERVASFIIAWFERFENCPVGHLPKPGTVMPLPMSRADLADYLGLTIETVSRTLSLMKKQELIGIDSTHEIMLLKPQNLAAIANGSV